MPQRVAFLLLAAGESKRLGRPKQLEPFQGRSLIRFMAEEILAAASEKNFWVVLGAGREAVENELAGLPLQTIFNPKFSEGMGGGISFGLAAILKAIPDLGAVLISVCDQTELRAVHLKKMLAFHRERPESICASAYQGVLGVPALFSKRFFPGLLALSGDHGGKKLIQQYAHEVQAIPFEGGERDLDQRELHST